MKQCLHLGVWYAPPGQAARFDRIKIAGITFVYIKVSGSTLPALRRPAARLDCTISPAASSTPFARPLRWTPRSVARGSPAARSSARRSPTPRSPAGVVHTTFVCTKVADATFVCKEARPQGQAVRGQQGPARGLALTGRHHVSTALKSPASRSTTSRCPAVLSSHQGGQQLVQPHKDRRQHCRLQDPS